MTQYTRDTAINFMNDIEISKLPDENRLTLSQAFQNSELYEQKLLEIFPIDLNPSYEYFMRAPLESWQDGVYGAGRDGEDYKAFREIFENKNWNEVDLNLLLIQNIEFVKLNENGIIYYLPSFLKYIYDLRLGVLGLSFSEMIISDLAIGCVSTRYRIGADGRSYLVPADYSAFERFTAEQSKIIAAFLVHVGTLSPSRYQAEEAKRALKNYWGKFLLL